MKMMILGPEPLDLETQASLSTDKGLSLGTMIDLAVDDAESVKDRRRAATEGAIHAGIIARQLNALASQLEASYD